MNLSLTSHVFAKMDRWTDGLMDGWIDEIIGAVNVTQQVMHLRMNSAAADSHIEPQRRRSLHGILVVEPLQKNEVSVI